MLIKHAFVWFRPALLTYLLRNKIFVTPAMINRQFPDFLHSSLEYHLSFKYWKGGKKLHDVSWMFYLNRLYFVEQVNYLYQSENVPKTCRWYEGSRMVTNASESPKKADNLTLSARERWEICVSVIVSVFCFVFVSFQRLFGVQGEDETLLDSSRHFRWSFNCDSCKNVSESNAYSCEDSFAFVKIHKSKSNSRGDLSGHH